MTPVKNRRSLQKKLLSWYRRNRRDLPWRRTGDPYRIMVSEVMLQQTQVTTVIPYYRRFLKAFPTVSSLARAPLQKVLKHWEGLGYYTRGRNLHRAAKQIREKWKGKVPSDLAALRSLPGIGRYTAGAIASIAFGIKAPVLDGNVRRVLCRLFTIREDPREPVVQDRLWSIAAGILPDRTVGDFNQALMELGATVCLPRKPACLLCPVRELCEAYRMGIQEQLPVRTARKKIPHHKMLVALIRKGFDLLIGPRPEDGLLAGLWSFPELEWTEGSKAAELKTEVERQTGLKTDLLRPLEHVVHTFSHKRVAYHPYLFRCISEQKSLSHPWKWVPLARVSDYPLPNATRKILDQLEQVDRLPLAAETQEIYGIISRGDRPVAPTKRDADDS